MRLIDADALCDDVMERYCKDCEKRKGIKRGKWRVIYEIGEAPCRACDVDDLKMELDEAPTIDAEPIRHGKWLTEIFEYELEPKKAHYFKCSVCRKWGVVTYNENIQKFKFCAFCGAKMDEDEISNIAKESADKISKALEKVRAKGMQKQNIKEDDEP